MSPHAVPYTVSIPLSIQFIGEQIYMCYEHPDEGPDLTLIKNDIGDRVRRHWLNSFGKHVTLNNIEIEMVPHDGEPFWIITRGDITRVSRIAENENRPAFIRIFRNLLTMETRTTGHFTDKEFYSLIVLFSFLIIYIIHENSQNNLETHITPH